jgi:hypothetical protein
VIGVGFLPIDLNQVIMLTTALSALSAALIGRANHKRARNIESAVEDVHTEVKSANGIPTGKNIENLALQLGQNPDTPPLVHSEGPVDLQGGATYVGDTP